MTCDEGRVRGSEGAIEETELDRRRFLGLAGGGLLLAATFGAGATRGEQEELFELSLAQWSLHRSHFGPLPADLDYDVFFRALLTDPDSLLQGELSPLDFPRRARELGFGAVEYVNTFFYGHVRDRSYLQELARRAEGEGVRSLLIMCDALGRLGDPDAAARGRAVEAHRPWLEAASFLGCHSIRVNAESEGGREEQQKLVADGLRQLCERSDPLGLSVLVENHGGLSSDAEWLAGVMARTDHPRLGTLPDFGNFEIEPGRQYDRYRGVAELMPWARAVSAKSYDFDAQGEETTIDFERMLGIVVAAGYRGFVGVEYEGDRLSETEGIVATRRLLEEVRVELSAATRSRPANG